MRQQVRRRVAWLTGAACLIAFALFAGLAFRAGLERRARSLDLAPFLQDAGLGGRVFSFRWERSHVRWLPRPALELENVEASLSSGQPGPGASSGSLRVRRLRLVPRWSSPFRHDLARIEVSGGTLSLQSDLLPNLPRFYADPFGGERRPVPYEALMRMIGDSTASPASPESLSGWLRRRGGRGMPGSGNDASPAAPGSPELIVRDLDIRFLSLDVFPVTDLSVRAAALALSREGFNIRGSLWAEGPGFRASRIPVSVTRTTLRSGRSWEARFGREGHGEFRLSLRPPAGSEEAQWRAVLTDPSGSLVSALLSEPASPLLQRLRWEGAWRLASRGTGAFPGGMEETRLELSRGKVALAGSSAASEPALLARGSLTILPSRWDLDFLSLRSPDAPGDSALLRMASVQTLHGRRVQGRLDGRLAPEWLGLMGQGWSARGGLDCHLTFEASREEDAPGWAVNPRGKISGTLDSLVCPVFAETLRQGRLEAWTEAGKAHLLLTGRFGESPFRLEAGGLPAPGPGMMEAGAPDAWWSFRSPWCRLEDFALAGARRGGRAPVPFWLALPGRGHTEITQGSIAGQKFESLTAGSLRSGSRVRLDSLVAQIAGGRVLAEEEPREWYSAGQGFSARLRGDDLDLQSVQRLLRAYGAFPEGELRGRLSGTLRVRRTVHATGEDHAFSLDGSFAARDGSVRGLPVQDALRRSTRIEGLSSLSFKDWRMSIHQDSEGLSWDRMRLVSPPLVLEGAGRIRHRNLLTAAFALRLGSGGTEDALSGLVESLLGEGKTTLYVLLRGTLETPSFELVSRSAFLREMDQLGASLPPG